ncbi:MAG: DUF4116 domain-containing protein [Clostridia bacterium]|nr:DUF4116 domain-containing protein [Clostridia bacterium]
MTFNEQIKNFLVDPTFRKKHLELADNEKFMLAVCKINGLALACASHRIRNNGHCVMEAIRQNGRAFKYASDRWKNDYRFINTAIIQIYSSKNYLYKKADIKTIYSETSEVFNRKQLIQFFADPSQVDILKRTIMDNGVEIAQSFKGTKEQTSKHTTQLFKSLEAKFKEINFLHSNSKVQNRSNAFQKVSC